MSDYQKLKAKRLQANRDLATALLNIIESDSGEQRFSQIMRNYGFVKQRLHLGFNGINAVNVWDDEFNLEPDQLLKRVIEECSKVSG